MKFINGNLFPTCSLEDPTPSPLVLTSGGRSSYGWQVGGTHPTGILSCYMLFSDAQEKSSTQDGSTTTNTAQVNSNEAGEADTTTSNSSNNSTNSKETVAFKVIYNKQKHDVTFPLDDTVIDLKKHLEEITGTRFHSHIALKSQFFTLFKYGFNTIVWCCLHVA